MEWLPPRVQGVLWGWQWSYTWPGMWLQVWVSVIRLGLLLYIRISNVSIFRLASWCWHQVAVALAVLFAAQKELAMVSIWDLCARVWLGTLFTTLCSIDVGPKWHQSQSFWQWRESCTVSTPCKRFLFDGSYGRCCISSTKEDERGGGLHQLQTLLHGPLWCEIRCNSAYPSLVWVAFLEAPW